MQQPNEPRVGTAEAELRLPLARVRILRYFWARPLDIYGCPNEYRVDLSLTPRPAGGVCFTEKWAPHQVKPIGPLYVLPPGQTVRAKGVDCGPHSSIVCEFAPSAVDAWFDGDLCWSNRRLQAMLNVDSPTMRSSLLRLNDEIRNPGFGSEVICELLSAQLAIDVARYCNAVDDVKGSGGLPAWKLKLIDDRLAELGATPSLGELAKLCNLSVRQLTRGFRASRGCSIGEHIALNRLDHARCLLEGNASVKEIAYLLGFANPENFSATFRRVTGEAPSQFRARIRRLR